MLAQMFHEVWNGKLKQHQITHQQIIVVVWRMMVKGNGCLAVIVVYIRAFSVKRTKCMLRFRQSIHPLLKIRFIFSSQLIAVTSLHRQSGMFNAANEVIDPGLWLTTLIFLSVAALFSLLSAVMALVNTVFNPIEPILR